MKPTWLVESHVGDEPGFHAMLNHLRAAGYPHHVMRFVPFSYDVVGVAPAIQTPCVGFGGAGVADYVLREKLLPGIWTGPQFSPTNYARHLGESFLNYAQIQCCLSEVVFQVSTKGWSRFFMRPDNDLKPFAGRAFTFEEVETWVADLSSSSLLKENDHQVIIAPLQDIGREWRTVVVDGEPIAWSQYKQDGYSKLRPSFCSS
jgi:hypothetical protein